MPTPDNQALMPPIVNVESDSNVHAKQGAEHRSLSLTRPLAFFDLETTGTIVGIDRIVELAIVKLWPNGERTEYEWRFNPEMAIPEEATRIHGIRDEDVRDKPTFRESLVEIREVFRDSDVAGFNIARFDMPLLQSELGLRPCEFVPVVAELLACLLARELPVDGDTVAVHFPVPCSCLSLQLSERRDSPPAQALTGEQADLDLRLVQPAAVVRGVMHRETLPQQAADLLAEPVHQRLAIM